MIEIRFGWFDRKELGGNNHICGSCSFHAVLYYYVARKVLSRSTTKLRNQFLPAETPVSCALCQH